MTGDAATRGRPGIGLALLARIGALYVRLVHATTRWEVRGQTNLDAAAGSAVIAAFWHGRLFLSPMMKPPGRRRVAMISHNRDGTMIAALAARFGVSAVRGSTHDRRKGRDKGGAAAYRAALARLADPATILAVTPDGPRGPRMRAAAGVARLARASGCPVLPVAFSTRRGRVLRSWDRFLLPFPFGRGVKIYGPLILPGDGDEAVRAAIEAALTAVTDEADRACGRTPVTPG